MANYRIVKDNLFNQDLGEYEYLFQYSEDGQNWTNRRGFNKKEEAEAYFKKLGSLSERYSILSSFAEPNIEEF